MDLLLFFAHNNVNKCVDIYILALINLLSTPIRVTGAYDQQFDNKTDKSSHQSSTGSARLKCKIIRKQQEEGLLKLLVI